MTDHDKAPMDEPCLTCGQGKRSHIYEEGACRPGFTCAALCEKFESQPKAVDESELRKKAINEFIQIRKEPCLLCFIDGWEAAIKNLGLNTIDESSKPKDAKPRIFLKASDIYHAWRELEKNTAGYYCFNEYEIEPASTEGDK